jgi:hypothetical protein
MNLHHSLSEGYHNVGNVNSALLDQKPYFIAPGCSIDKNSQENQEGSVNGDSTDIKSDKENDHVSNDKKIVSKDELEMDEIDIAFAALKASQKEPGHDQVKLDTGKDGAKRDQNRHGGTISNPDPTSNPNDEDHKKWIKVFFKKEEPRGKSRRR